MADEIKDAKDGLKTRLETISGLRVLDYGADSINEFPCAVILFTGRDVGLTMRGSSFGGEITIVLLISSADSLEAYDELDKYMAPLGTESIEAAIDGDNTWNSKVDDGRLMHIGNIGFRELFGNRYMAADLVCAFTRSVAT